MSVNPHILLIDDDPTVNFLNRVIIEKSEIGAATSEITHAPEALDQLANGALQPSLILLDLNMPDMDGWEFLEAFEKLPDNSRQSKVIILSSSINPSDRERAESISFISDFYSKPLSLDDVREMKKLLDN